MYMDTRHGYEMTNHLLENLGHEYGYDIVIKIQNTCVIFKQEGNLRPISL